jgi:hypothetical protein
MLHVSEISSTAGSKLNKYNINLKYPNPSHCVTLLVHRSVNMHVDLLFQTDFLYYSRKEGGVVIPMVTETFWCFFSFVLYERYNGQCFIWNAAKTEPKPDSDIGINRCSDEETLTHTPPPSLGRHHQNQKAIRRLRHIHTLKTPSNSLEICFPFITWM